MQMWFPVFLLFSVYGVINTYLPLFLRNMGYSITTVGVLLAIFEIAGLAVPFVLSPLVDRRKNYGIVAVVYGFIMVLLPFPLMFAGGFWLTALFLAIYAVGFKGAVPVTDSHISYLLGTNAGYYGRVRAAGSAGFVLMALILQFATHLDTAPKSQVVLWLTIPALLFTISMFAIPGLLKPCQIPEELSKFAAEKKNSLLPQEKRSFFKRVGRELAEFPRIFWAGMGLVFLSFLGLVPASKFLPLYIVDHLQIKGFALLWAVSAASEIPFMFFAYRFLRHFNTLKVLLFCTLTVSVRTVLYILFPSFGGAVVAQLLNTVNYGIFHPAAILFVSQYAPKKHLVLGMTLYSLVTAGIATVLGNLTGGFIIDRFGYTALFLSFAVIPLAGLPIYFKNKDAK